MPVFFSRLQARARKRPPGGHPDGCEEHLIAMDKTVGIYSIIYFVKQTVEPTAKLRPDTSKMNLLFVNNRDSYKEFVEKFAILNPGSAPRRLFIIKARWRGNDSIPI